MEFGSLILSIIGAATVVVYFIRWTFYSPRTFIRIGGERGAESILIEPEGLIPIAIGTLSKKDVTISKVWIAFDSEQVEVWAKGIDAAFSPTIEQSLGSIFKVTSSTIVLRAPLLSSKLGCSRKWMIRSKPS